MQGYLPQGAADDPPEQELVECQRPPLPRKEANGGRGPGTYLLWLLPETRHAKGEDGARPGRAADRLIPLLDAPARQENES